MVIGRAVTSCVWVAALLCSACKSVRLVCYNLRIAEEKRNTGMRETNVKAKNVKVGDYFEGRKILAVVITEKGNVSMQLEPDASHFKVWRRRPADEIIPIGRAE